ncbi:LCP family protein [Saccharothrix longispora]|uniref:LCP family protein required for cell wall assembly n=1 Tax=Saccharothrix longispora TaxID=33920 RepID=A0ABU1PW63_9PSEU|nr:LCP family protein [Saccharothrix longispora]MDR6594887.1 LCP family protein required for cell wall assembly [Saccharothrix longispora]
MTDQESLIREAVAAEAEQRVDHREVLARLHAAPRRRRPFALVAVGALTAAAAVAAVAIPLAVDRAAAPVDQGRVTPPTGQTVLLLGLDDRVDGTAPRPDALVLVRLSPDGSVSAVSLPRDTRVSPPGAAPARINSLYGAAHERARREGRDPDLAGTEATVAAVEELTGARVDHWAALDMGRFAELSTAVGGVEVCLAADTHDVETGFALPAGRHVLVGEQAALYLRQRKGQSLTRGDLDRVQRHQVFLRGLLDRVGGPEVAGDPVALARVMAVAHDAVRTDEGWDAVAAVKQLTAGGTRRFATLPVDAGDPASDGLPADPARVRPFVADALRDPVASDAPALPGSTAAPACVP